MFCKSTISLELKAVINRVKSYHFLLNTRLALPLSSRSYVITMYTAHYCKQMSKTSRSIIYRVLFQILFLSLKLPDFAKTSGFLHADDNYNTPLMKCLKESLH